MCTLNSDPVHQCKTIKCMYCCCYITGVHVGTWLLHYRCACRYTVVTLLACVYVGTRLLHCWRACRYTVATLLACVYVGTHCKLILLWKKGHLFQIQDHIIVESSHASQTSGNTSYLSEILLIGDQYSKKDIDWTSETVLT